MTSSQILIKTCGFLLATAALPVLCVQTLFNKRWRVGFGDRLGLGRWRDLTALNSVQTVWFHGASMGEIVGLQPVISEVAGKFTDVRTIVTTTSLTGRAEADKRSRLALAALMPLDHPWIVQTVIRRVNPSVFVLAETELWPNLLMALRERNVPTIVINGRISDYSFPRYLALKPCVTPFIRCVDRFYVQTETDKERFVALGAHESDVLVSGCTKYDRAVCEYSDADLQGLADSFGLNMEHPVFVAGSVRQGEDRQAIAAYQMARKHFPELQMIIAPRHPERFQIVADLLLNMHVDFNRRSSGVAKSTKPVMLLDTVGELSKAYALARASFVGGSMVNIGGHNPLEPASCGSPVIMGNYVANVRDAVQGLRHAEAIIQVSNENELCDAICCYVGDEGLARRVGARAREVWKSNLGVTGQIVDYIGSYLNSDVRVNP